MTHIRVYDSNENLVGVFAENCTTKITFADGDCVEYDSIDLHLEGYSEESDINLLTRYTEWLDDEGEFTDYGRSWDALVQDFLDEE